MVQKILLRVSPGIDPHTHRAVVTGSVDSKFGVAIETGQAIQFVEAALKCENLELLGIHCHTGSQPQNYIPLPGQLWGKQLFLPLSVRLFYFMVLISVPHVRLHFLFANHSDNQTYPYPHQA